MNASFNVHTGGRASARWCLVAVATVLSASLPGALAMATAGSEPLPQVSVREEHRTYTVTARFEVSQAADVALAVLTDYEQIPRFMPDVRTSVVLERTPGRLMVAQEAVSHFMMFSRKVHLLLEVTEEGDTIRFVDRCGKSFTTYAGVWRAIQKDGGTTMTYDLTAHPAFDVPEFILKRLLKRDSGQMIDRLRREIAARAARRRVVTFNGWDAQATDQSPADAGARCRNAARAREIACGSQTGGSVHANL